MAKKEDIKQNNETDLIEDIDKSSSISKLKDIPVLKIKSKHIIFISDIHFGKYSSSVEWQNNIKDYFKSWFLPLVKKKMQEYPDLVVMCLGDVYDDRKSIDIDVNNLVIDTFEEIADILPVYILYGNHDLSKKSNKGNSSLRSLSNIKNLTIISEPTLVKFMNGRSCVSSAAAIPYLGDCNEENKNLVKFTGEAKYAFMHTEITSFKFDSGQTINGAVDYEKFDGIIYSGHIHKRQESKRVIYVGSPYQLTQGESGNSNGIYILDVENDKREFIENTYSPKFKKIDAVSFLDMFETEQMDFLDNSYVIVNADESEVNKKYKDSDIYAIINRSNARRGEIKQVRTKTQTEFIDIENYVELSVPEIATDLINNDEEMTDEQKARVKEMSDMYYKEAFEEINNQI